MGASVAGSIFYPHRAGMPQVGSRHSAQGHCCMTAHVFRRRMSQRRFPCCFHRPLSLLSSRRPSPNSHHHIAVLRPTDLKNTRSFAHTHMFSVRASLALSMRSKYIRYVRLLDSGSRFKTGPSSRLMMGGRRDVALRDWLTKQGQECSNQRTNLRSENSGPNTEGPRLR